MREMRTVCTKKFKSKIVFVLHYKINLIYNRNIYFILNIGDTLFIYESDSRSMFDGNS